MTAQWVRFANGGSVAGIPMTPTHYAELARKGLNTYKNHMRVVERRGDSYHHTLAVWPKDKTPNHQQGPGNCYDTYLTSTQGMVPYAAPRGDPVPSKGDEGFLYLVPNYEMDKTVFKWGPFRIERVIRKLDTPEHLMYTLHIEKITTVPPHPSKPPKSCNPTTPKRNVRPRDEGTSSAGKKKQRKITSPSGQMTLGF
jgi:hypothetical protein